LVEVSKTIRVQEGVEVEPETGGDEAAEISLDLVLAGTAYVQNVVTELPTKPVSVAKIQPVQSVIPP
jgi:hypothetical protein